MGLIHGCLRIQQVITLLLYANQIFQKFYQHEDGNHFNFIFNGCHCYGEASD